MSYYLVKLLDVPRAQEDELSSFCFDHGALGVSETLKFKQTSLEYDPEIIETPTLNLEVYFSEQPQVEFVHNLKARFPEVKMEVSEEQEKDWLEEWKKGFEAFALVGDVWVVPSWLKAPAEAKSVISMDPGMAFGTGTHETTRLAARMLHGLTGQAKLKSMLDVGTGTGVLSILAELLGLDEVEATEIDPIARTVAVENVERNLCQYVNVLDHQVEDIQKNYDVVVANIIDGVLIRISESLKARTKPQGYLVLTGILEERAPYFLNEFLVDDKAQYKLLDEQALGEWRGYLLQRLS